MKTKTKNKTDNNFWKYGESKTIKKNFTVEEIEQIIEFEKQKTKTKVFLFTFWLAVILAYIGFYFSMSYKFGFICTCEGVELFNMTANEVLHTKI